MKPTKLFSIYLLCFSSYINCIAGDADFTYNNHCINNLIYFNDLSVSKDEIVSWFWDFGDGGIATDQSPVHAYTESGNYDVSLTIKTINGEEYTERKTVEIKAAPFAFFDPQSQCDNIVGFKDNSFTKTATVKMWMWDFGDGNYSLDQNPEHQFDSPDDKDVHLKVLDRNGCGDSITQSVNIIEKPKSGFDIQNIILSNPAIIKINSHNNEDSVFYLINNQIISGKSGYIAIDSDKENEIVQKVVNKEGCVDSTTLKINPKNDYHISLPSLFSPSNGNTFGIRNSNVKVSKMRIFDTNGKKVFSSSNRTNWNGKTSNGTFAKSGVYIYTIDYTNQDGINITQKGKFILKN